MVQGIPELHARFERVVPAIEAAMRDEIAKQADSLVRQIRQLAPKGATGKLAASVNWTWGAAPEGARTLATTSNPKGGKNVILATIYAGGKSAYYAPFVEFGTTKMAAQPFFFPTYRANKKRIRGAMSRRIREVVRGL